jgi:valyl-tRNA synthetase
MEILIPMAGLIDKDAELARITKAMDKVDKDVSRTRGKLGNEKFVSNAPDAVIEKERGKLEEGEKQLEKLKAQYETIAAL